MCSLLDGHPNILGMNPASLTKNIRLIVKNVMTLDKPILDTIHDEVKNTIEHDEWTRYFFERTGKEKLDEKWSERFEEYLKRYINVKDYSEKEVFLAINWLRKNSFSKLLKLPE